MTPDSRTPEIHNHRRRRRRPSCSPPAPLPSSSLSIVSAVKRICALVSLSAVFSSFSSSPLADAAIAIPVTTNFRFDGTHSDMAQQYYLRWLAGDQVAPLSQYNNGGLPTEVDAFLHQQSVRWLELPGLMQRAILWDLGFVITTESKLVRVSVRCGRSMADIFVPRKAYERIGCLPKACSVPTGELFYRHNTCEDFQAAKISLCAVDFDGGQIHSAMWGDGAVEDDIPDISLARHSWGDNSLMYSIHTNGDDAAYNFCPSTPSIVIPCAPLSREKDQSKWCVPERGVIVEPWIQNFGDSKRPKHGWIMIEFVFFMMLVGSTVFGLHDMVKNKKMRKIRELELQEALLADFANRRQRQDSRASASGDPDAEVLERALDAAAFDHFESSIAMTASAHFDSFSSSLKTLETRPKGNSIGSAGTGSGSSSSDVSSADVHLLELSLEDARRSRRFDRSISASSSISLLSGHRSQVAIRSFHLFESHRPICRKRVAFRDIQFKSILSRGTTGEVWLATLRGSYVAVKQLVPTKRRVLKEMEMFMAEIYLLSQLSHPNIVQLVGVAWNTLEHVVMVQDWMQRGDLQQFLASRRPSNPEDPETPWSGGDASSFSSGELSQHPAYRTHRSLDPALELDLDRDDDVSFCWKSHKLEIARSIAKALLYLHSLTPQLLHRDVKSKNVLLSDAMEVKLCDFGISRRKHHMDESDTNLTVTAAAGTMSWTAPEVLLGEDYGEKVDIYSYGILLCEVDTCVLPYHDPASLAARLIYHPLRLMKQVIGAELRPAISPSCPPRIVKLIHACLDRDPEKRPAAYEIVEYLGHGDERV